MKIIVLAGGGGSRLFPLSRKCFPKQFLKLEDEKSLLAHTVERFLGFVEASDIIVVTNKDYLYHVQHELSCCNAQSAHILLEPVAKNTAPAIALAAKYCEDVLACAEDEVLFVAAADHVIREQELFTACMRKAAAAAQKKALIVFGIKPDKPETGYGYIEAGRAENDIYEVHSFKEKPELPVAEKYVAAGNYYWNSGMFAFTLGFMFAEMKKYQPDIIRLLDGSYEKAVKNFDDMPNISIDYAIAEKTRQVKMVPLTCYWNDIGSWDAMYDILAKDEDGNALKGDCMTIDCSNSLFVGRDRLIAGIGVDDLLLVETDDVIVVAKKGESQKVKNVVESLKKRGRKEAEEHTTLYRSWGSTSVLGEGKNYRMKKIQVNPGKKMSLHLHYHRSEHWIVLSGTAQITMEDKVIMIHENESIFIPPTTKHCLANPGKIPLNVIEVQNGSYVGEDDIVRFDR